MANQYAVDLIKEFEGLYLAPYLCPAGVPTIGYGSTYYEDGTKVALTDEPITEERAEELLSMEAARIEVRVRQKVGGLSEPQFGAIFDFAYNLGISALLGSTLFKKAKNNDIYGASEEFGKWVWGGGKKLPGLVRRRAAERELWLSDNSEEAA